MKVAAYLIASALFLAGCATTSPTPPAQLATVHLCYELVTGDQKRGAEFYQEIQRRNENCDKYQGQVALMIQAESQRRTAAAAALMSFSAAQKANQQSIEDAYWGATKGTAAKRTNKLHKPHRPWWRCQYDLQINMATDTYLGSASPDGAQA